MTIVKKTKARRALASSKKTLKKSAKNPTSERFSLDHTLALIAQAPPALQHEVAQNKRLAEKLKTQTKKIKQDLQRTRAKRISLAAKAKTSNNVRVLQQLDGAKEAYMNAKERMNALVAEQAEAKAILATLKIELAQAKMLEKTIAQLLKKTKATQAKGKRTAKASETASTAPKRRGRPPKDAIAKAEPKAAGKRRGRPPKKQANSTKTAKIHHVIVEEEPAFSDT